MNSMSVFLPFQMKRVAYAFAAILLISGYLSPVNAQVKNKPAALDSLLTNTIADDQTIILQQSIDLEDLLDFYQKDVAGNYKKVHIMQYPVVFPAGINVSKFGQKVAFLSRPEIHEKGITSYFLIKEFTVNDKVASVSYDYYYEATTASVKAVKATLSFEKANNTWTIVSKSFEKNHIQQ